MMDALPFSKAQGDDNSQSRHSRRRVLDALLFQLALLAPDLLTTWECVQGIALIRHIDSPIWEADIKRMRFYDPAF